MASIVLITMACGTAFASSWSGSDHSRQYGNAMLWYSTVSGTPSTTIGIGSVSWTDGYSIWESPYEAYPWVSYTNNGGSPTTKSIGINLYAMETYFNDESVGAPWLPGTYSVSVTQGYADYSGGVDGPTISTSQSYTAGL